CLSVTGTCIIVSARQDLALLSQRDRTLHHCLSVTGPCIIVSACQDLALLS
ncbi:predicted protein, partial [Nematostella vectensis]